MDEKVKKYIDAIVEVKWWKEKLYWIPTDIIWFWEFGKKLAFALEPLVMRKEICFFDLDIKEDDRFHYWWFMDMFKKTELMIFTKELPESYFNDLSELNLNVTIIVDESFKDTIRIFQESWFSKNIISV